MHWITNDTANTWTAWATIATAAVALVGATAAVWQISLLRRDSHDRTRPYVQVDVVPGVQGAGSWDLIIENRGASTALDVVIDVGEVIAQDSSDHIAPVLTKYLLTPKTLVPGARRRVMWGYSTEGVKAGILSARAVSVSYSSERRRRYAGSFFLDGADAGAVFPVPTEGPVPGKSDMLEHINKAIRTLNVHVGELRR